MYSSASCTQKYIPKEALKIYGLFPILTVPGGSPGLSSYADGSRWVGLTKVIFHPALPTMICTSMHVAKWTKTIIRYIVHNIVFQINTLYGINSVIHKSPQCKYEVVLTVFTSGCLPHIKSDLFGALTTSGSVYPATAHHM